MTIEFNVNWKHPPVGGEATAASLGWGAAILKVGGSAIWFSGAPDDPRPVEWSWIELLEFLAEKWFHLQAEQAYPLGLTPDEPRNLRREAKKRWDRFYIQEGERDLEDEKVFQFEGRHDLSRALRGISLPSVLIVREGANAWVSTENSSRDYPLHTVLNELEQIGDVIAERITISTEDRARNALHVWKARASGIDARKLIALATGRNQSQLPKGANTLAFWELEDSPTADSELAAAARFLPGTVATSLDLASLLAAIREVDVVDTTRLDDLGRRLQQTLRENERKDRYVQGYALARAVVGELHLSEGRTDPEKALTDLGVPIIDVDVSPSIDAIGCWGRRHGPAVLVNKDGAHSHTPHGRRATLAHELCHLLVDRNGALPLAEVMGGRAPYLPERRANAFAAEFLLPHYEVRMAYKKYGTIDRMIEDLMARFEVGSTLAAGQILSTTNLNLSLEQRGKLEHIVKTETR